MNAKDLLRRYAVFTAGLYFLALGVVLIVRSQLGTTPISSANYVLSVNTPLTLGTWTTITNMLMIAAQLLLVRGCGTRRDVVEILMQAPFSLVFGLMIDLNMVLTAWVVPSRYVLMILTLLLGCVIQAFGIVLEIRPAVAMMSAEGTVKYICRRYGKEFGRVKVWLDVSLVCLAIALSLLLAHSIIGVREGTLIAAFITGHIVTFLNQRIKKAAPVM